MGNFDFADFADAAKHPGWLQERVDEQRDKGRSGRARQRRKAHTNGDTREPRIDSSNHGDPQMLNLSNRLTDQESLSCNTAQLETQKGWTGARQQSAKDKGTLFC